MHKRDRRKNPKETEFHELCDSTLVFSSFYEESVPLVHGNFYTSHGNMHDKQITDKHLYDPQLKKKNGL